MSKDTEWLAELNRLGKEQPNGFSTREFAEAKGISIERARNLIKQWLKADVVRCAGWRECLDMAKRPNQIPVYIVVKKAKK